MSQPGWSSDNRGALQDSLDNAARAEELFRAAVVSTDLVAVRNLIHQSAQSLRGVQERNSLLSQCRRAMSALLVDMEIAMSGVHPNG